MEGYSFRSLTDLVLKIFKTKVNAGTGLSGGGSLEADRTLTVNYGTAAGTATQGNDSRVVNAASNATVDAKEAALEAKKADKTITITAGTGLAGGGTLAANRTLSVSYGTAAGTATQGNDSRLSNSREWTGSTISQAEAEEGTATTRRAWTAQRVRQAIVAWAPTTATRWPTLAEVTGKPTNYPTNWATVKDKPVVQTVGTSTTNLMSQKAVTDLFTNMQPTITGSCVTNGTTNNTVVLTGIVPALALEVGDVIQITGSTGGLNNKLFTVETITNNNSIIVNYEHAGNRGNGSLKLANQTATVTITRIAKWYNAPVGLGQDWVNVGSFRVADTNYSSLPNRLLGVAITSVEGYTNNYVHLSLFIGNDELSGSSQGGSSATKKLSVAGLVPTNKNYRVVNKLSNSVLIVINYWMELR